MPTMGLLPAPMRPIISAGDAIGAVAMISKEPGDFVGDTELKVCETAANFMGKQMEN